MLSDMFRDFLEFSPHSCSLVSIRGSSTSVSLTLADHVNREGDTPSQRYRMVIWDEQTGHTFLLHQPMSSFTGYPNEARSYNQFRPCRLYSVRIEPMARLSITNVLDLDYMAEIAFPPEGYYLSKFGDVDLLGYHENRSANWFDKVARFQILPGEVDLDGQESLAGGQ